MVANKRKVDQTVSMSEFRSPIVILNEAELMASAPEVVAEWLKNRKKGLYDPDWDDALESALISRKAPLIDLALARYGVSNEVLRALFSRGDLPLRVAALSNENVISASILFRWKFVHGGEDLSWMGNLTRPEIYALFSNPGLPDLTISDFFEGMTAWLVLDEDQRLDAVDAMTENLVARSDRDDFFDGWDDYSYSKVFDSAWSFADRTDVNLKWAARLGNLYRGLTPRKFSEFQPLDVAKRWYVPSDDFDLKKHETDDNERGYLGHFQQVRLGLARLAAGKEWQHKDTRDGILKSDDVAIRCGGYLGFAFTSEGLEEAWQRDRKLAARFFVANDKNWSTMEGREALDEICRRESEGDDYDISLSREFHRRLEQLEKSNPEWFEEEEDSLANGNDIPDPILERIDGFGQRLANFQTEVKWGFVILLAFIVGRWFY